MTTETKLVAFRSQAEHLVKGLQDEMRRADETGETAYVRVVLEQLADPGPWHLVIGVHPEEGD